MKSTKPDAGHGSAVLHLLYLCDMNVMYLLIGCSIVIALGFLGAFLWSVRSGQFDDVETPAMRMLLDPPIKPDSGKEEDSD